MATLLTLRCADRFICVPVGEAGNHRSGLCRAVGRIVYMCPFCSQQHHRSMASIRVLRPMATAVRSGAETSTQEGFEMKSNPRMMRCTDTYVSQLAHKLTGDEFVRRGSTLPADHKLVKEAPSHWVDAALDDVTAADIGRRQMWADAS